MTNLRCDVCGFEATTFCQDVEEGEPITDSNGRLWRTYTPKNPRWRCDKHWEPPKGAADHAPTNAVGLWLMLGEMDKRQEGANRDPR